MVKRDFTHSLLKSVVVVVVVVEVGLIGTGALFRIPEPSAPGCSFAVQCCCTWQRLRHAGCKGTNHPQVNLTHVLFHGLKNQAVHNRMSPKAPRKTPPKVKRCQKELSLDFPSPHFWLSGAK